MLVIPNITGLALIARDPLFEEFQERTLREDYADESFNADFGPVDEESQLAKALAAVREKSKRYAPTPLRLTKLPHPDQKTLKDGPDVKPKRNRVTTNRSLILATARRDGLPYIATLAYQNVLDLEQIIHWNHQQGITLYRLSSDIFPFSAKLELYRRVAAPYEDSKIKSNGDTEHLVEELNLLP